MVNPPPDDLHPRLRAASEYWMGLCDRLGRIPQLAEIDLMQIYEMAPYVFIGDRLQDVEGGTPGQTDYRWRYWGTAVRDLTGSEATGKRLSETHDAEAVTEALQSFADVLQSGKPDYWKRRVRTVAIDRSFLNYERIVFPLLNAAGEMAHVFGVFATDEPTNAMTYPGKRATDAKIGLAPKI